MVVKITIAIALITSVFCTEPLPGEGLTFTASTPGDEEIKKVLTIPPETKIDFIRWNLVLTNSGDFDLKIAYGESKPNTLGFVKEETKTFEGQFFITNRGREIYHLKAKGINGALMLAKINENLFHILGPDQDLMVGNGGWSYVLNNLNPVTPAVALTSYELPLADTARQWVFDGRTPCREFATDHGIPVNPACFKFKWRIILNRDPKTQEPTTYSARRIVYDVTDITGKWVVKKLNNNTSIIQLNPDNPNRSISLVQLDDNILYFLDKNGQPYTGNGDFSFALNKVR